MPCLFSSLMTSKICTTICGARPSDGSSSRSSLGRAISARAMASICCSPPESSPPAWACRFWRIGNIAKAFSMSAFTPARVTSCECAHLEVLADGESGEDLAPLRRLSQTHPDDIVCGNADEIAAVELDLPRAGLHDARDAHERRRFARAVGADQRHDLAALHRERDSMQDVDRAVAGLEILDLEQGRGGRQDTSSLPR